MTQKVSSSDTDHLISAINALEKPFKSGKICLSSEWPGRHGRAHGDRSRWQRFLLSCHSRKQSGQCHVMTAFPPHNLIEPASLIHLQDHKMILTIPKPHKQGKASRTTVVCFALWSVMSVTLCLHLPRLPKLPSVQSSSL